MSKHIVIMAGGTGGHVYPALATAEELIKKGYTISWLGCPDRFEAKAVPQAGITLDTISISALRGKGITRKLQLPIMLSRAIYQARTILKKRQPALVLGMGGFAAAPGGIAARILGIPLVIHEQNAVAGLTNRILARFATQVFTAYEHAFPSHIKTQTIGNPLRQAFLALPAKVIHADNQPLNILITGGSQGARCLNQLVPQAIALLNKPINIWHQSGEAELIATQACYTEHQLNATVSAFIEDMPKAYCWADLIICRAGALTVSETQAAGLPAIFIPLPYAADDHQRINAEYLSKKHLAWCLQESELTAQQLCATIEECNNHRDALQQKSNQLRDQAPLSAAEALAEQLHQKAFEF